MALVFIPQYKLTFDNNAGQSTNWQIDILRSYDDDGATPSWVSNPVTNLIGTGEPITIDYSKDRDVYKPLQGSSATLNVVFTEDVQYENFSSGGPYEWRLSLKYRDTSDNLQTYWEGYFNPTDSTESITSYPYTVSHTALDGLGLLEESQPDRTLVAGQANAFQTLIVPALNNTGLEYSIYVQSNVLNGGEEAFTTATVDSFSIYKSLENRGELYTHKELLEGYLRAWNCKITQANGRWYIYNASTLQDNTTWKVFNTQGVAQADVVENLVYQVDGSDNQALIPVNDNLVLSKRRPYGSVECRPEGLVEKEYATNGSFQDEDSSGNPTATGWSIQNNTWAEIISSGSNNFMELRRQLRSYNHNDSFVFTNGTAYPVDAEAPIEAKFDWRIRKRSGNEEVTFRYQIRAQVSSTVLVEVDSQYPGTSTSYYSQYTGQWRTKSYQTSSSVTNLFWDSSNSSWTTDEGASLIETTTSEGGWISESQSISAPTDFSTEFTKAAITDAQLFIRFYPIVNGPDSLTDQHIGIDNISVRNMFTGSDSMPVFERLQEDYTQTIEYNPLFSTSIADGYYQKINPTNFVFGTKTTTLEQLATQWKLNDFRREFKYYEGAFVNATSTPLSNINKIRLNWASESFVENPGIMNGGSFMVKSNIFDTSFYIPNQSTDQTSEYFEYNVDLIPESFQGIKSVYTLALRVDARDENNDLITNGLVPSTPFIRVSGRPGDVINEKINLVPGTGFRGNPVSTTIAADTDSTPRPEYTEVGPVSYVQGNIEIPITITLPVQSEFEELFVEGGIVEFIPEESAGVVSNTITFTHAIPGISTPMTLVKQATDTAGVDKEVVYQLDAGAGNVILNTDSTHTDDSLDEPVISGVGTQVVTFTYNFNVPGTPQSIPVTITGSTATQEAFELEGVTRQLIVTNNIPNTVIVDGERQGNSNVYHIPFSGFNGDTIRGRKITVEPQDANYFITSIPTPSFPSGVSLDGIIHRSGADWEIPIDFLIGDNNLALTIGGTSALETNSITFNVVPFGLTNASVVTDSLTISQTFNPGEFGTDIAPTTLMIYPAEGHMFTNVNEVDIDINEARVRLDDGSTTTLPNNQFSKGQVVLSPEGIISIQILGTFPSTKGIFTIDVNIVGGSMASGGVGGTVSPVQSPATSSGTSFRLLNGNIPSTGGTAVLELETDGAWNLSSRVVADVMIEDVLSTGSATGVASGVNSDDGTISATYSWTDTSGILDSGSLNIRGAYSPTNGQSGSHLVEIKLEEEDFFFKATGFETSGLNTTFRATKAYFSSIQVFIDIHGRNPDGSDGTLISSININQSQNFGGRTYFVDLSDWDDRPFILNFNSVIRDAMQDGSSTKPQWLLTSNR